MEVLAAVGVELIIQPRGLALLDKDLLAAQDKLVVNRMVAEAVAAQELLVVLPLVIMLAMAAMGLLHPFQGHP
jgi:hypothetical protein